MVRPELPDEASAETLIEDLRGVLASGLLTNGEHVRRLEQRAARRLGAAECVATASCTAGLMLAVRALGLKGEVILPSFTFCASGQALLWNNLAPVFVDCDRETFLIDPAAVRRAITPRTSAILGVHVFGAPAPAEELEAIAAEQGLRLLFDSAHAFGSSAGGRPVGSSGDVEVFSLSPTKPLVGGEGGLVTTNDSELAEKLRAGRNYGDSGDYDPAMLGLSARMNEMSAALAWRGLDGLEARIAARNRVAAMYTKRLENVPGLSRQKVADENLSTWKDFSVVIDDRVFGASRDAVRERLAGVAETRAYFDPPLHCQRLFQRYALSADLPNTDWISRNVLSLPIHSRLSDAEVNAISDALVSARGKGNARPARAGQGA